jgi:hypothetical protein
MLNKEPKEESINSNLYTRDEQKLSINKIYLDEINKEIILTKQSILLSHEKQAKNDETTKIFITISFHFRISSYL